MDTGEWYFRTPAAPGIQTNTLKTSGLLCPRHGRTGRDTPADEPKACRCSLPCPRLCSFIRFLVRHRSETAVCGGYRHPYALDVPPHVVPGRRGHRDPFRFPAELQGVRVQDWRAPVVAACSGHPDGCRARDVRHRLGLGHRPVPVGQGGGHARFPGPARAPGRHRFQYCFGDGRGARVAGAPCPGARQVYRVHADCDYFRVRLVLLARPGHARRGVLRAGRPGILDGHVLPRHDRRLDPLCMDPAPLRQYLAACPPPRP